MALTALSSAAEVLVATGHDPFARGSLRRPLARGWLAGRAVAWMGVDPEERVSYLNALGPPAEVGALLADLLPELPPNQRLTVPRGTAAHLPAWVSMDGTDWDLRWLGTRPPAQPGEDAVEPVDDNAQVHALLTASSPTASAMPGDPAVRRWVGIHEDGQLIACAADTSGATGVGHLSSIAVHPSARGRGLGAVITAALSREMFDDGCDIVTLGMYADNTYGRAMYDQLGFADDHRFTSGPLVTRARW
ncbi:MAG: GNAT family N-acetyltransferase [Frankiaceae bacterium]|nr:GNAT family N-acetyltransferase [Frankiaceae bacterium]